METSTAKSASTIEREAQSAFAHAPTLATSEGMQAPGHPLRQQLKTEWNELCERSFKSYTDILRSVSIRLTDNANVLSQECSAAEDAERSAASVANVQLDLRLAVACEEFEDSVSRMVSLIDDMKRLAIVQAQGQVSDTDAQVLRKACETPGPLPALPWDTISDEGIRQNANSNDVSIQEWNQVMDFVKEHLKAEIDPRSRE